MAMTSVVISILLTIGILLLSLLTISKGYGYKHTVDPKPDIPLKMEDESQQKAEVPFETNAERNG